MRAVVQRVSNAKVEVEGKITGQISNGLMVLLGVEDGDDNSDMEYLADKVVGLRIFEDDQGKMNLSVAEIEGELLVVSQFTLLGDARKGRRPSFVKAAEPEEGNRLYEEFVQRIRSKGLTVQTGIFRAMMDVTLTNQGPVTMLLDSRKTF